MDIKIAEQFLDELFSSLEAMETQSAAILQFLKDHGNATDEQLAPYLEQASKASNVRWRAARVRLMSLLSSAVKTEQERPAKSSQPEKGPEMQQKQDQQKAPGHETQGTEGKSTKDKAVSPSGQKASEPPSKDETQKVAREDRSGADGSQAAPQPDTTKEAPQRPTNQDAA